MQIRKTYIEVNPELLYAEIRDFALKQGVKLGESLMETYTLRHQQQLRVTLLHMLPGCGKFNNFLTGRGR